MVIAYSSDGTYEDLEPKSEQRELVDRMSMLAHENFARRAAHYDQTEHLTGDHQAQTSKTQKNIKRQRETA